MLTMALGANYLRKEYAWCIGIVFLMFGLYKSSQVWGVNEEVRGKKTEENANENL